MEYCIVSGRHSKNDLLMQLILAETLTKGIRLIFLFSIDKNKNIEYNKNIN